MFEAIARLGYLSKSLIYFIVGALAAAAALNAGGRVTDTSGALRVILRQPFGQLVLLVLAVGLGGYALWRLLDAIQDPDHRGTSLSGLIVRGGSVIRGTIYGALGFEAFRLAQGLRGSSGREAELWTGRVMDLPLGFWLVGLVGASVVAYGVAQVVGAVRHRHDAQLDLSAIPASWRGALDAISRFGVGARGVIVSVAGIFLMRAAWQGSPAEAHGTRESVLEIANAIPGRWALAALAAGLLAYAVDQALHARYRRIRAVV